MNIYDMIGRANHLSRFRPSDEKMIERDRKDYGGEGLKVTYRRINGGTVVEVWKNGENIRRIQRRS